MNSFTEENYLKSIYKLIEKGERKVATNSIAGLVDTAPASVTDMLKKLADKKLINYEKYQGVSLTTSGRKVAVNIIRRHRLWEMFLVQELDFKWDEVHDIAEQLEHIVSDELVEKLDDYLGNPKFDPHGDPIPDENGNFSERKTFPLSELTLSSKAVMTGVIDHTSKFLRHIEDIGLSIGKEIKMVKRFDYDRSCNILIRQIEIHISHDVAKNILVSEKKK